MSRSHHLAALEACLFASGDPLDVDTLAEALEVDGRDIESLVDDLRAKYNQPDSGIELLNVAGGVQIRTRPEYAEAVEAILKPDEENLSAAALETLALVAYRQPVTRPEIEQIRGVSAAHILKRLEDDELIEVLGRKDAPGRPNLYGTTDRFLQQFGLASIDELPPLPESAPADQSPTPDK